jgi:hypothetical protein
LGLSFRGLFSIRIINAFFSCNFIDFRILFLYTFFFSTTKSVEFKNILRDSLWNVFVITGADIYLFYQAGNVEHAIKSWILGWGIQTIAFY